MNAAVLVVDDDLASRRLASLVLADAGVEVMEAATSLEALRLVRTHRFDAVLMDVSMPVMSGFDLVRMIRADPRIERLHIIGYTAHAMGDDLQRMRDAGFDDVLVKPVEAEDIIRAVSLAAPLRHRARPGD